MSKAKTTVKKNPFPRGVEREELIKIGSSSLLAHLAGEEDKNLRQLALELGVRVTHTVDGVLVYGLDTDVEFAVGFINQLVDLISKGGQVYDGDISRGVKMLSSDRSFKLEELIGGKIEIPGGKASVVPKNPNQKLFLDAMESNDIVFGVGPAGTGKTFLAIAVAVNALLRKKIRRIIMCRPAVEAGEKLGFLPGDMNEKVNPYLRPMYDSLFDLVGPEKLQEFFDKEMLEIAPLAYMRGRTLRNCYVILDEAQNTTTTQMKMFLTRLGSSSKFFITGDVTQIDLVGGQKSGLVEAAQLLRAVPGISVVKFHSSDVVRHPLVSRILEAYKIA